MFRTARLTVLLLLALFAGGAAAGESQVFTQKSPGSPVVHTLSDFEFPLHVGSFERGEAIRYSPTGDDVSMGYNEPNVHIVATLYVYPAHGRSLAQEFASRQREVTGTYPKVKLLSRGWTKVTPKARPAMIARYLITADIRGEPRELRSELLVAQTGKWFVEYRISYAAENQEQAQPKVDELKAAFAWP